MTRYERARIVGARALQISHGAPVLIETDGDDFRPHDVALKELRARVLPIGLARKLPNFTSQVIPLNWLKDREFITQIDIEDEELVPVDEDDYAALDEELKASEAKNEGQLKDITQVSGIGDSRVDDFHEHGFTTVESIASASVTDLTKISGIGQATAKKIISAAKDIL